MLSERTQACGMRAASGLLGVDALYRAERDAGDGLVVLNMDDEGALAPQPFTSWRDAREWFEALLVDAEGLAEPDRAAYYAQLCRSTLSFVQWRETGLAFRSRIEAFLHVPARPVAEAELDALCDELRALLHGLGYHGDLARQCAAWEERNRVPPDEVPAVLAELLDRAWDRTEQRLLRIPAAKSDGMRVAAVAGVPYNARCDYNARMIELNVEPTLTRPGLKHLAVHEGCPGHYVQFRLRETMYASGEATADVLLSVVNTASSSVFEGVADAGLRMLDWIESDDDRVQSLLNRHRAGITTGAAWRVHAEGWAEKRVTDWLRSRSLAGGEGWVTNRMRFIAAPSRAVLIWSYWWGEPLVASAWDCVPESRRPAFLRFLYGRMHSPASVGMFG